VRTPVELFLRLGRHARHASAARRLNENGFQ
jgi:hypothetical protein